MLKIAIQETELNNMLTEVKSMSLPDASSLSFPDDGSPCPPLNQIPELKAVSEKGNVNTMCKSLGDRLNSIKAGLTQTTDCFSTTFVSIVLFC